MTARRSGSFPVCRLTSEDAHRLADIFEGSAATAEAKTTPSFRFETLSGTFTYDTFTAQSRRWSQREVKAIEMVAKGNSVWARLYLDLEDGGKIVYPTGQNVSEVRSKLEVEGDEEDVFQAWDQIMAVVAYRGSALTRLMNAGLSGIVFVGSMVVVGR